MSDRVKKIIMPFCVFCVVFILHLLYFKLACVGNGWLTKYLSEQEYFLGASYGLSFGFMSYALLVFGRNKKAALKAAGGSGIFAIFLLMLCFFFGCCSSPMLIVYLNLLGLSALKVHKGILLLMTVIFITIGYAWLNKKICCCEKI